MSERRIRARLKAPRQPGPENPSEKKWFADRNIQLSPKAEKASFPLVEKVGTSYFRDERHMILRGISGR
jgi:hypothetical protein